MLQKIKAFVSGCVFTLAVAIPVLVFAQDLLINQYGSPSIIADGDKELVIGTEGTGDIIFKVAGAEAARVDAATGNFQTPSGTDVAVTGGDFVVNTTDRGVGADAADQTVKICGGVAGAGCDAEAIGAWAVFEGVDFGGAAVGGGIQIEGGAGDATSDVTIATNHDDADILLRGGSTQATRVTVEGDTGNVTLATGSLTVTGAKDVIIGGSGTVSLQEATAGTKCMGTATATGTNAVTVSTTCATTGSRIFISRTNLVAAGVTEPGCWATNIVNGTSFDLDCNDAAEDSTFDWIIFHESA